nr:hypothetical protein [Methylomarinum sp. Ch1-1]MDP4521245.1 hypothetical protein [Methylomarinum sp. Ch1-1]
MQGENLRNILKKILSASELQEGIAWHRRNYDANSIIIKQGDLGQTLFLSKKVS